MTKKKVVKKPVKRVKKALTLRQVLDVVEGVLIRGDDTAMQLWNVLTALRGPDSGDWTKKHNHTVPIRRAAFPKIAECEDNNIYIAPADFDKAEYVRPLERYGHFVSHIRYAAESLGLESE